MPSLAVADRSGTSVVLELKEDPLARLDIVDANCDSPMLDTSGLSKPAAAIIWGLRGLVVLARLPFLECCTP